MSGKKNIILFRGENKRELKKKLHYFRQKFIEKYGDTNLQEVYRENMSPSILADCCALGFMGTSRMIIFHEILLKTDKEIKEGEIPKNTGEETKSTPNTLDESIWIKTLSDIPDSNFILFLGNKKPVGDLEKWIEDTGTVHDFLAPSVQDMMRYIMSHLSVSADQAGNICERLGYYDEFKWGKASTIGKPDFIYPEVDKLSLLGVHSWTDRELDEILPDYREENIFNIMAPLWQKDAKNMIYVWEKLIRTGNPEIIIATMITMIRKVLISAFFGNTDIPSIKPTQREMGRKLASQKKSLKKLYDEIIAIDIGEKGGELPEKKNAFLMTLLHFCIS